MGKRCYWLLVVIIVLCILLYSVSFANSLFLFFSSFGMSFVSDSATME